MNIIKVIKNHFLRLFALYFLLAVPISYAISNQSHTLTKPDRLKSGDTVGLVASASYLGDTRQVDFAIERLKALGLKVVLGKSVREQNGYFSGTDQARAKDINDMFANSHIKAILEVRGGWGCARILPYLDYMLIHQHPKIIMGFSDITTLLLAIEEKAQLVTFHGPMAAMSWPSFTVEQLKKVLFDGQAPLILENPRDELNPSEDIIQTQDRIQTLIPGTAKGILIGGNLSIMTSLLGTPYEPNWQGKILFIEDVNEFNYRIDRMMEQLDAAGVFKKIKGFIFGTCSGCRVNDPSVNASYGAFTIQEILMHYLRPYHIPAYMGAMIGHNTKMFTLPEGVKVEMNADSGSITLLESPVLQ